MKKTITLLSFLFATIGLSFSQKVQVAILFDTSNSMDGLIDQAKSRIWNIVNEVSSLSFQGQPANIEIALYQYGNSGLSSESNYIQRVLDLSSDMDEISQKLFGLKTNGGNEYCGAVIEKSLQELNWSSNNTDLKMIYIAGNEPFNQGPVAFKEACKKAVGKDVFVNTIYCGNYDQGVREFWKDGATCSEGDYFNIDSDKAIVHIDTPFDADIQSYNDSLNTTYFGYGRIGVQKKSMQLSEDANAQMEAPAVATERAIVKSKNNAYSNSSWDLIDAEKEGKKIEDMKDEELPEEFKNKSPEQRRELLEVKKKERENYQVKITELAIEREAFIAEEKLKRAENGEVDDFGSSVNKSILEKAESLGYKKETPKTGSQ